VNQVNATVKTVDLPVDTLDAYVGTSCSAKDNCGIAGIGLENYETSYNENLTVWMICLGNPVLNTTLTIGAAYLRDWTELMSNEDEEGLTRGGIAGIVIACVVAFLFIVGLTFSLKGTVCWKKMCSCFKNKISTPGHSPRDNKERIETGIAGNGNEISH
jgi:hypothetical protein